MQLIIDRRIQIDEELEITTSTGIAQPPASKPNSAYYQTDANGNTISTTVYDENGAKINIQYGSKATEAGKSIPIPGDNDFVGPMHEGSSEDEEGELKAGDKAKDGRTFSGHGADQAKYSKGRKIDAHRIIKRVDR